MDDLLLLITGATFLVELASTKLFNNSPECYILNTNFNDPDVPLPNRASPLPSPSNGCNCIFLIMTVTLTLLCNTMSKS